MALFSIFIMTETCCLLGANTFLTYLRSQWKCSSIYISVLPFWKSISMSHFCHSFGFILGVLFLAVTVIQLNLVFILSFIFFSFYYSPKYLKFPQKITQKYSYIIWRKQKCNDKKLCGFGCVDYYNIFRTCSFWHGIVEKLKGKWFDALKKPQ